MPETLHLNSKIGVVYTGQVDVGQWSYDVFDLASFDIQENIELLNTKTIAYLDDVVCICI